MKHEKSPQLHAGCLRGFKKSDYKTIPNSNTKNNAPDKALLYGISEYDRESIGRRYMFLAVQYGHVELQEGLTLYTTAGIETLGLETTEGVKAAFPSGAFFFVAGKYIFECTDPLHVLDCMEGEREKAACGYVLPFVLPITYKAKEKRGEL
jgi:hypothetical protein